MKQFDTFIAALIFTYFCCLCPQVVSFINKHSIIIATIFLVTVVGQFVYDIFRRIHSDSIKPQDDNQASA